MRTSCISNERTLPRSGIVGHLRHLQRPPSPHQRAMQTVKQSLGQLTPMRIRVSGRRDNARTIYRILLKVLANARLHISAPGWTSKRTLAGLILEVAQAPPPRCSQTDLFRQIRARSTPVRVLSGRVCASCRTPLFCPLFFGLISGLCASPNSSASDCRQKADLSLTCFPIELSKPSAMYRFGA